MRKTVDLRALVLALVLVAPSLVWISVDRHVWPWDQAWYGEVSCDLWFNLTHSITGWIHAMITALGQKPPAAVWMGQFFVPLGALLPSIESALLLSIVATQAVTLILLALVFREIDPESRWGWAIGCAFAGSAPLFAGLSHQFFTEPLQAVTVAWAYLIAVRAFKRPRAEIVAQLVCCGLLGLLAKSSTPLFMIVPFLLALRGLFGPQPWLPEAGRRRGFAAWLVIGAALLLATGVWYGFNFREMFVHALQSSVDSVSLDYGWKDTFWNKAGAWGRLTVQALFGPGVVWAVLACTAAGVWLARHRRLRGPRLLVGLSAVAQFAIVIAAFSSVVTVETRYLLAVVPTLAVLVFLAATLARSPVLAALWMAVMLWQWGSTFASAFGLAAWPEQTAWLIAVDADSGPRTRTGAGSAADCSSNNHAVLQHHGCRTSLDQREFRFVLRGQGTASHGAARLLHFAWICGARCRGRLEAHRRPAHPVFHLHGTGAPAEAAEFLEPGRRNGA